MQTNWYVITGGPSCGKTTLRDYMSNFGYHVYSEPARNHMNHQKSLGNTIEDITSDFHSLQNSILQLHKTLEERIDPFQLTFLDRGIPDSIAYQTLKTGRPMEEFVKESTKRNYAGVFILDQCSFEKDSVRIESPKEAEALNHAVEHAYRSIGYDPVRVPLISVHDRMNFILSRIGLEEESDPLRSMSIK